MPIILGHPWLVKRSLRTDQSTGSGVAMVTVFGLLGHHLLPPLLLKKSLKSVSSQYEYLKEAHAEGTLERRWGCASPAQICLQAVLTSTIGDLIE